MVNKIFFADKPTQEEIKTSINVVNTNVNNVNTNVNTVNTRTSSMQTTLNTVNTNVANINSNPKVIKSIQRGTAYIFAGTVNPLLVTISSVVLSKSFLEFSFMTYGDAVESVNGTLSSSSQIAFRRKTNNHTEVEWQVIEFY
ncbi:hypothetical protein [Metabacillus fastidiosus]|uniref:hypothetical protein n=1 Tax=Metabacillus fastidiosus TaxID=1458 RepID=UPI003D2D6ED9